MDEVKTRHLTQCWILIYHHRHSVSCGHFRAFLFSLNIRYIVWELTQPSATLSFFLVVSSLKCVIVDISVTSDKMSREGPRYSLCDVWHVTRPPGAVLWRLSWLHPSSPACLHSHGNPVLSASLATAGINKNGGRVVDFKTRQLIYLSGVCHPLSKPWDTPTFAWIFVGNFLSFSSFWVFAKDYTLLCCWICPCLATNSILSGTCD